MTSESSSSPRVITGSIFSDVVFSPLTTAADALPAIAKDMPAAPHTGNAGLESLRLEACFARAIGKPLISGEKPDDVSVRTM
jgi:hypothetical protein